MAPDYTPRPDQLVALLAEEDRLQVFAAVVLGASDAAMAAKASGLPVRTVMAALRRLEQGGLVADRAGELSATAGVFKDALREYAPPAGEPEPLDPDQQRAAVLRNFIVDGRLSQMPAAYTKRRIVLEHIAAVFEPGVRYPEKDVNAILRAWYEDHAALRRYLVDEDLLAREEGLYWRTGGYVELT